MSLIIRKYPDLTSPVPAYSGRIQTVFSPRAWRHFILEEDGSLLPLKGVTNELKIISKEALVPWAVKTALARARKLIIEKGLGPDGSIQLFVDELDQILAAAKKADTEALEDAGEVGHAAHDALEKLIKSVLSEDFKKTCEVLALTPSDERAENCFVAGIDVAVQHNIRWIASERRALSLKMMSCGTLDALARMDSCSDRNCCPFEYENHLVLADFKTSNCEEPYASYLFQTAFYQAATEEEFPELGPIDDRWIFLLGKYDGEFSAWPRFGREAFESDLKGYQNAVALGQSVKDADAAVNLIAKQRREYQKRLKAEAKSERLALECEGYKKYKGVRPPKCNDGNPCEGCLRKYAEKHPTKE